MLPDKYQSNLDLMDDCVSHLHPAVMPAGIVWGILDKPRKEA